MSPDTAANSYRLGPDERGHFGLYGGRYVAETLMPLIREVGAAYEEAKSDPAFHEEMGRLHKHYTGRPSPLYFAERLTARLGGAKIYFKRDELNHTGSHKINNCLGQMLLARRMGKTRIIAETGAGQHGVAAATVCARFDLPCTVYMGSVDIDRQAPNVFRMRLLGAEVRAVESGSRTLKDALNEALRDWVANVHDTFYIIGTAAGPAPYPEMVRDFQCVIGDEVRTQIVEAEGRLPDTVVACIGGGSNAIGLSTPSSTSRVCGLSGWKRRGAGWRAASTQRRSPAAPRGSCTATAPTSCRTTTAKLRTRIRSRPVSTIRESGRSTPGSRIPGGRNMSRRRTRKPWKRSSSAPGWRASSPRWSRRMRSPGWSAPRPTCRGTISW